MKELCGTYEVSYICKAAECYAASGETLLPISWGYFFQPFSGVSLLSSLSLAQLCQPKINTGGQNT